MGTNPLPIQSKLQAGETVAPVTSADRVIPIDVLRGAALFGVLLMNLLSDFRIPLSAQLLRREEPLGWAGAPLLAFVRAAFEFKAFTLFSFLFGVGLAIQAGRRAHTRRDWFLVRRCAALFAIGVIHMLFIWNGDILALYGVCGLLAVPLLRLPDRALLLLGLLLIAGATVAPSPVAFPPTATLQSLAAGALATYPTGSWPELFAFRLHETCSLILPLLAMSAARTLGLMLWGAAAWRKGWMVNRPRLWRWALAIGLVAGIAGHWLDIDELSPIGLALAYGAALLLWHPRARWVAAIGQMALTNYLLQSIIFGFLFYSYGLGWFGKRGVAAALLIGVTLYLAQLAFSAWWLKRFRFGPVEWLWRSISYLQRQPFLRVLPLLYGAFIMLQPVLPSPPSPTSRINAPIRRSAQTDHHLRA